GVEPRSELSVFNEREIGRYEPQPFLQISSSLISIKYLAVRNRNRDIKLVGLYDCSTIYGSHCGVEETHVIKDCREKFSPLGGGFFTFVDTSRFNRLGKESSDIYFNEIVGIYRRNNAKMHILFSNERMETDTYLQITIGDGILVRVRTYDNEKVDFNDRLALKKGFNRQPSEPNFIRIEISS
ncbi:hypothetical protein Bhyg_15106, partial [Pseudolycoriella hygida]